MIPQRVKLKGFLCYKDEQEIGFDGNATLWMLSGLNGSGKSSIFDAVTFALFGHHRGGGQHNQELINKDSDGLLVEFEFLLDGKGYRAKRTLKRDTRGSSRGTQQLFRLDCGVNGAGKWLPLEDTGSRDGFNNWISDNIGLNYETFTSSVLLLQGKAEKLLDSKPEGRRTVLASIVDLERYERLHAKTDDQRKKLEKDWDLLKRQLESLPEVKPEELAEAEQRIQLAESARAEARAEVERLRDREHQAKAWVELQSRLASARQRWEQAQRLLSDAADIERQVERLRELREVLPRLHDLVRFHGEIHTAEIKTKSLNAEKQKANEQLAQRDSALKQARDKRTALQGLIAADENRHRDVAGQLPVLAVQMEKLKEYERHEAELKTLQVDLSGLPADPSRDVFRSREKCDALTVLSGIVPYLMRFHSCREELRQAAQREQKESQRLEQVESKGRALAAEVERLKPLVEQADLATRQASEQATEARTLCQQEQESLREITQLDGAKMCRHCGQPLTPGHLQDEKRRRTDAVQCAEIRLKKDNTDLQLSRKTEKQLREQCIGVQKTYQDARDEWREAQNQQRQTQAEVARLQNECSHIWNELPQTYRCLISPSAPIDWLTTCYPSQEDLQSLRSEVAELPAARQRQKAAESVQQRWNELKAAENAALATMNRRQGELPADRDVVRTRYTDLILTNDALLKSLGSNRRDVKEIEADLERLSRERDQAQTQLKELEHRLREQELVVQHARQLIGSNTKALPPSWHPLAQSAGLTELHGWEKERSDLEATGADQRGKDLQHARLNLDLLRQEKDDLETRQETFPVEARCDPEQIQLFLVEAGRNESAREGELSEARHHFVMLNRRRQQREQIGEDAIRIEGEFRQQETLAKLLGKNHLQLHLVRQAEKEVVEHANSVLDRLSGGQLYLKLRGETDGESGSDRALDLEAYNRITGEQPINVAFLSGSQKFRVAVSLALGIGQYASRQHRPIESVIIDEGFGCLDSQGRQVMIQELQNLRSQMRCILLVSHQEDFAEAFADGYRFELENGSTRITPLRK